jgi:murein DD-endopeptidase MepM/ murein hydrolase activator NlpD
VSLLKKIKERLRESYRFVIMDSATFEEKVVFKLTALSVLIGSITTMIILIALSISLVTFTSLKEYIPGYGSTKQRQLIAQLQTKMDSLDRSLADVEVYEKDMKAVLLGKGFVEDTISESINRKLDEPHFSITTYDSILAAIEENTSQPPTVVSQPNMLKSQYKETHTLFFPPVKGIKDERNVKNQGVALACKQGASLYATTAGTVIYTGYDADVGMSLIILHPSNIATLYRYTGTPLVSVGDIVKASQLVAVLDADQIVYFELWIDGNAVHPGNYMLF